MGRDAVGIKRREWSGRLRRFSSSGMTVADFCDAEGVSVCSFYVWRRKLAVARVGGETPTPVFDPASRPTFVPVRLVPQSPVRPAASASTSTFTSCADAAFASSPTSPAGPFAGPEPRIEIVLPNGVRVLVPTSDAAVIRQAILTASHILAAGVTTGESSPC